MNAETLDAFDIPQLERLHAAYTARNDAAAAAAVSEAMRRRGQHQTPDMADCGRLFERRVELDPSGLGVRPAIAFTGDIAAFMEPFMRPGLTCRLDESLFRGENSPEAQMARRETVSVRLRPGERIQILKDEQ